jgi:hypothetical protein
MSNITNLCTPSNEFYPFGIYEEAEQAKLTSSSFTSRASTSTASGGDSRASGVPCAACRNWHLKLSSIYF